MDENIRKLFGTDGIRGLANKELTPELVLRIGRAAARFLTKEGQRGKVLIGKDSRPSGDFWKLHLRQEYYPVEMMFTVLEF